MDSNRILEHPILEFTEGEDLPFSFDGKEFVGKSGDTIASALHAAGVRVLGHHFKTGRPRGFYCAIGNCSSCLMIVNGVPNVRVCVEPLQAGMVVCSQNDRGVLP
jgi:predicted molibdopterin-dependent oxidoreductase YjgC